MKRLILFLFLSVTILYADELKKMTFEQAYQSKGEKLLQSLPATSEWADNSHYYETKDGKLFKVKAVNGKSIQVLDPSKYQEAKKFGFDLLKSSKRTKDFKKFLCIKKGDIYLFFREKNKIIRVTQTKGTEEDPTFSPDGNQIAYTLDGNLYVYHIMNNKITQLTRDGCEKILNGYASYIYYEEVHNREYKSFWWSPDSNKIVFVRYDQSFVPIFPIFRADGIYGDLEKQRYPKPGYPNPEVKIGIAHLKTNTIQWIPFNDPNDHYLAFPVWFHSINKIHFQWMNRGQNHIKILRFDLDSNQLKTVYQEKQKAWVEFFMSEDFYVLKNNDAVIRSSKDGWYHIYYIYKNGKEKQLTSGEWSVTGIKRINEKRREIYFNARKEDSTESDFYRIDFNGKKMKRLTPFRGSHRVTISPTGSYFLDEYSSIHTPPRLDLRNHNGKRIRKLGDSYLPVFKTYDLPKVELFRITTGDGYKLPAKWYLPSDFNKDKKYPVILSIYGGPGSPTVRNGFSYRRWRSRFWWRLGDYFLAQQGIIIISVDHRGSGHFGKKGMDLMHRNLGKWEMNDYIEAIEYLKTLPFIDKEKIGITGGSYGGYVTSLALTYGSDTFKYGIAGASVIDWKLYDSIYTERYMDTPKENPKGYKNSSVLTYTNKYKRGLRITHGTMDDNVHMQNIIQFIDKILDAEKTVELMVYPGQRHGVRGKKRSEMTRSDVNFWLKHFFNKTLKE